jgi:transposase-like protein
MPQLQATIQTEHLIERYPCPKCDWYMIRIEPEKLGYNLQHFECSKCGYEAELIAKF